MTEVKREKANLLKRAEKAETPATHFNIQLEKRR